MDAIKTSTVETVWVFYSKVYFLTIAVLTQLHYFQLVLVSVPLYLTLSLGFKENKLHFKIVQPWHIQGI